MTEAKPRKTLAAFRAEELLYRVARGIHAGLMEAMDNRKRSQGVLRLADLKCEIDQYLAVRECGKT